MQVKRLKKALRKARWNLLSRSRRRRSEAMWANQPWQQGPVFEAFEPRLLLSSVIVVDSLLDVVDPLDGVTTFREALLEANQNTSGDPTTITFNITDVDPGEVATIVVSSSLPTITQSVIIDGTTQAGYTDTPLIEIHGTGFPSIGGIYLQNVSDSVVQGLSLHGFTLGAIRIESTSTLNIHGNNTIQDNYIGIRPDGTAGLVNQSGVSLGNSHGNLIQNNVIANATQGNISMAGNTQHNVVRGNLIGTDATGTAAVGSSNYGIVMQGLGVRNNQIGEAGAGNVISGGNNTGIFLAAQSQLNTIQGNYIGTDITGTTALGNNTGIIFGLIGSGNGGRDNIVGGTGAGEGNIISGNAGDGITLTNNATGNVIVNNRIGVDVNGDAMGNGQRGVAILQANNNTIGGYFAGEGNTIAHNGSSGVQVQSFTGTVNNAILGNAIYSNQGLGIDLFPSPGTANTPNPNDPGDNDTGANNLQNHPVIFSAETDGATLNIVGELSSKALTTYRIELFASEAVDPSGYGEGEIYLGFFDVTTDASGVIAFDETFAITAPEGYYITATATDPNGNTSEFSGDAVDGPPVVVSTITNTAPSNLDLQLSASVIDENGTVTLTVTFDDPDVDDEHTVLVQWGDGQSDLVTLPVGDRVLNIQHQYLDNNPGDAPYTISVTVTDSHEESVGDTTQVTVENVAPSVDPIAGPTQVLRGQDATFTSSFTDPGTLDTHTLAWSITDAGNAVVATGGGSSIVFNTSTMGDYTVTFTVTDNDGASDSQSLSFSVASSAVAIDSVTGDLTYFIAAEQASSNIVQVRPGNQSGVVRVIMNGQTSNVTVGDIERIVIYGGNSSDIIKVDVHDVVTEIYAGGGSNILHGGNGGSIIVGGSGNDIIHGGNGRNLLISGGGSDIVMGGKGDDILIAGWTIYDNDRTALNAILAEWSSDNSYQVRIDNIQYGTGLNGNYMLNNTTVFHSGHSNILMGKQGDDWFFALNIDITDAKGNEVLINDIMIMLQSL